MIMSDFTYHTLQHKITMQLMFFFFVKDRPGLLIVSKKK